MESRKKIKSKTLRVGGYSIFAVSIVLVIAVAFNILVQMIPSKYMHIDMSPSQYYTLSEQTKQILQEVETPVTIYWVVRDGYQNDMLRLLLEEYQSENSLLKVEEIDPDVYPTFTQKYTTDEARDNTIIVENGTFYKYYDYYDIFVFEDNGNGAYDINFSGEKCITSGIEYAVKQKTTGIVSLTGHGEQSLSAEIQSSLEKENITVSSLLLSRENHIPEEAGAVLIDSPQTDLSTEETRILSDYLASGGHVLLITNPEKEPGQLANIRAWMEGYGVHLAEGVVVETNAKYFAYETPYYLLPYINAHTITNPLTRAGYFVLMPISAGLQVTGEQREGVYVSKLLTTSEEAFSKWKAYDLDTYEKEEGDTDGPFALAVAISEKVSGGESRIVWAATDKFLEKSINELVSGGNMDFFLNIIDWIVEKDESSIAVRSKSIKNRYLVMDSGTRTWLKIAVVAMIPLLYLGIGAVVLHRRRKRSVEKPHE